MKASVCLIQPPGYIHSLGLLEVCQLLCYSFESLGWSCTLTTNSVEQGRLNVVVGYHLLGPRDADQLARAECVFYQLEQLSFREGWFSAEREGVLRAARAVWDYSAENIAFLRARGFDSLALLPLGHHAKLRRIEHRPEADKDVDVLFYGSLNERRAAVLDQLRARRRVQSLFGVYGGERDAWVARSRIVLNLHFYQAQILEQVRLSYLLSNACCVVSEESASNPMAEAVVSGAYGELAELCLDYLADAEARRTQGARALSWIEQRPMAEFLRAVLQGDGSRVAGAPTQRTAQERGS
jgi:hypothetical protein